MHEIIMTIQISMHLRIYFVFETHDPMLARAMKMCFECTNISVSKSFWVVFCFAFSTVFSAHSDFELQRFVRSFFLSVSVIRQEKQNLT